MITFCLTSCERPDLLERTLDSFFQFNTYPISKYIISEDSPIRMERLEKKYPYINFVYNDSGSRYGMMRNLQNAYSFANTKFIFSCEDDWEFYRNGFIEKSIELLNYNSVILQVWLRALDDTNGHPINLKDEFNHNDINYYYVETGFMDCFHGYSTNPGLRRKKDVADFGEIIGDCKNNGEDLVSKYYFEKGFRSVILPEGYVRHIGYNRTVV